LEIGATGADITDWRKSFALTLPINLDPFSVVSPINKADLLKS
jgi:hypothetical protein